MLLSVLLLLLLVGGTQAGFYGYVLTYSAIDAQDSGYRLSINTKVSFSSCSEVDLEFCNGTCGMIVESSNEWCQKEIINSLNTTLYDLVQDGFTSGNWTENLNGITSWILQTYLDLRNRSDIGQPNSSPQTTILPLVRIPSNCPVNIDLLNFDPNGDEVKCRYANGSLSECVDCTPPPVLSLSPSCSLSFSPTNSSSIEGPYVVQLMMEDFPRQTITLTPTNGSQEVKTTNDFISKIPIQFVLKVDPAVPSCTEGIYLPKFMTPTPSNRAQLEATVNQTLEIFIRAGTIQSEITDLLFSGPPTVEKNTLGFGNFTLRWTPSDSEGGLSHPICFIVQANLSGSVYQSELRCVVVTVVRTASFIPTTPISTGATFLMTTVFPILPTLIPTVQTTNTTTTPVPTTTRATTVAPNPGPQYIFVLNVKISTTLSLESNKDTITTQIKNELINRGLPSSISVRFLSDGSVQVTTAAP